MSQNLNFSMNSANESTSKIRIQVRGYELAADEPKTAFVIDPELKKKRFSEIGHRCPANDNLSDNLSNATLISIPVN